MSVTRRGAVCAAVLCLSGTGAAPALAAVSSSPSAVSAVDKELLTAAHQGNLWEIATSQDARSGTRSSCVRQVAAVFVRDHRRLDAGVTRTASRLDFALPAQQSPALLQQQDALRAAAGKRSYDTAWLKTQYTAHVQSLALIDKELAAGTSPAVKALAEGARPVVVQHAQMVRGGVCHGLSPVGDVNAGAGSNPGADNQLAAAAYGPQGSTAAVAFAGVLLGGSGLAWVARRLRSSRA
jgi:putative membrane protein